MISIMEPNNDSYITRWSSFLAPSDLCSGFAICVFRPQLAAVHRGGRGKCPFHWKQISTLCTFLKLTRSSSFIYFLPDPLLSPSSPPALVQSRSHMTQDNHKCSLAHYQLEWTCLCPTSTLWNVNLRRFTSFSGLFIDLFVFMSPLIIASLLAEWQYSHLQWRFTSPSMCFLSYWRHCHIYIIFRKL